ncbi:MAG TPA: hypothetical protein VGD54_14115 [Steroidobacteraceae bacterium]
MYDQRQLLDDAAGYGIVVYAAHEGAITWASANWTAKEPFLQPAASETFLASRYALVKSSRSLTIYRFYGSTRMTEARLLGSYWTPSRPALRIDQLGYSAMHDTLRADLALERGWNPMTDVVEATLQSGSWIFVGRVASQIEGGLKLGGGTVQFFLPAVGHQLRLDRRYAT